MVEPDLGLPVLPYQLQQLGLGLYYNLKLPQHSNPYKDTSGFMANHGGNASEAFSQHS